MVNIKESEPWLLWPNTVSYGMNKNEIGKTFEGETDFTLSIRVKILSKGPNKRTLFAKLPNYMGLDIEKDNNNILFICNFKKNNKVEAQYFFINNELGWDFNFITIRYNKLIKKIDILINDINVFEYQLDKEEELSVGEDPHIIFGAGNFPHNGFNLNYCSFDTNYLLISKNYLSYNEISDIYEQKNDTLDEIIGLYNFEEKTDYKINDLTGNCNFIHKIIYKD